MFSIAHAVAWHPHPPSSSSSSLAHALGFAPAADDSEYIDIQPHSSDDAVFRLPPLPAMAVLIPPLPQQAQRREVKPEPAEPTLHAQGLVYVFEHARRTEDGSVSFDLCDEESLLARGGAVAPEAEAGVACAPKRGMKAMMGVFRVDPFTTGPRVVEDCDGDGDGDGEEDDPGASFEFQMEMEMDSMDMSVTGRQRDAEAHAHTQHVPHDPRPALLPFISAASCPGSPTASSSPASHQMQMDHPTQHSHSRPSTAASSRSASSFAPAPASASVNTEGAKKKPKKVKMHACDVCHKEFPRPSGLQTHMNVHSGAKPYKCPVPGCSKRFGVRSNATRHLRVHQRQQAHAASQQHRPSAASIASSSAATTMDSWLDLPADVLRPTPADVLAAHHPHPHPHQQQQRWVPDSLQHLSNALELPAALRGPRVEGVAVGIDAGASANEWPYHPSQWASKLPGPGPLRQQWAAPSHAWVGA